MARFQSIYLAVYTSVSYNVVYLM